MSHHLSIVGFRTKIYSLLSESFDVGEAFLRKAVGGKGHAVFSKGKYLINMPGLNLLIAADLSQRKYYIRLF